jgi:hypothetical protein
MQVVTETRELNEDAALARILHHVTTPPETSRIFRITPKMAKALLEKFNLGNRPKKEANIARYVRHMLNGTWGLTGDTIKFSDKQLLRDGQNRLIACLRSGETFTTHVVFGIDDSLFDVMDQGKNRDGADVLAIAKYANTTTLAGAVRWQHLLLGDAKSRASLEPPEILAIVETKLDKELMKECVGWGIQIYDTHRYPRGLAAGALYVFSGLNPRAAREFATGWASGQLGGRFTQIGNMHKALQALHQASNGRVHDTVRAAYLVIAWNLFVQGKRGRKSDFDWVPTQDFPEILAQ